ncbi:MAG TPA: asparaginase [Salinisphaeraceae bacterium]|nr:asparaginase [Salinisphaeraceae bacterium]
MPSHPQVVVLGTGGTIATRLDPDTGAARVVASGDDLVAAVPELGDIADVSVQAVFQKTSFLVTPADVQQLAVAAREALAREEVTGVVVTHGTDTMEESAFLLELLLDPGAKPVVFTGAQLSGDMAGADGPRNLINAVRAACDPATRNIGVVIAFADSLLAARDATKSHTSRLEAFTSSRGARLGELGRDLIRIYRPAAVRPTYAIDQLETNVALIHLAMGMDAELFDHVLEQGARGIVLAAFGIGNANPAICEGVARARERGVPVAITSRCGAGAVTPVYAHGGGVDLQAAGAIFAGDLSPEKARLALMVLLGRGDDIDTIRSELPRIAA